MNALLALLIVGLIAGSLINAAIYALAWHARPISPWQRPHPQATPRRWSDFLPIIGWLGLRREEPVHGRGFWVRPLLIELCCGIGLPLLYWWETVVGLPTPMMGVMSPTRQMLHHEFLSHAILIALMLVATFIDFDEKTIPDEITIPGALIGLGLAAAWPDSHLRILIADVGFFYKPLLLTSTREWPLWLNDMRGLALGLAIFVAWCAALIPALATLRRGWWNGAKYYLASIARESAWWKMLLVAVLGSIAIVAVWRVGGASWQALLSSLVGLGFGGGLVWAVRIAGRVALHKEAMGFGDVTLMAMIGAFLGWQACLIVFAISPFAALLIAVSQFVLTGRRDIPYGPYLCASATAVIVKWPWFWEKSHDYFATGWVLPAILVVCLVLLMALLMIWRFIEGTLFAPEN